MSINNYPHNDDDNDLDNGKNNNNNCMSLLPKRHYTKLIKGSFNQVTN